MQEITIQLVTWNSAEALKAVVPSLQEVPADQAVIRVIDNASIDQSIALIRHALPQAEIVELPANTGFAGGHNEGFKRCTTPYVLVLNPDVALNWAGIASALEYFKDAKVGAVQGKLYRHDTVLDSTGVVLTAALNGRERGAGEKDTGQYEEPAPLIAVTGACGLYRLAALKSVQGSAEEIFDRDFWAYKEDVDLGWRLIRAGWQVWYIPVVMGTHARSLKTESALGWRLTPSGIIGRLRNPRTALSARNWLWLIMKNASGPELLWHSPAILGRLIVLLVLTAVYWPLAAIWPQVVLGGRGMIAKRSISG